MRNTYYNKELFFKQAYRKHPKKIVYKIRGGKPLKFPAFQVGVGLGVGAGSFHSLDIGLGTHLVETFTGSGELKSLNEFSGDSKHYNDPNNHRSYSPTPGSHEGDQFYEQVRVQVKFPKEKRNRNFGERNLSYGGVGKSSIDGSPFGARESNTNLGTFGNSTRSKKE